MRALPDGVDRGRRPVGVDALGVGEGRSEEGGHRQDDGDQPHPEDIPLPAACVAHRDTASQSSGHRRCTTI